MEGPATTKTVRKPRHVSGDEDDDGDMSLRRVSLLYDPSIKVEDVIAYAHKYERFFLPGAELKNLPTYDDVTAYGIPEAEQHRLWGLEIRRLLDDLSKPEQPLFETSGFLKDASPENLRHLGNVSDQVLCSLSIIYHDNLVINEPEKRERQKALYYHATKVNIRRLVEDFEADSIAKVATKLKVLEKDPANFASISLETEDEQDEEKEQYERVRFWDDGPKSILDKLDIGGPKQLDHFYHHMEWSFRETLHRLFLQILTSIIGSKRDFAERPITFDVTSRVYRTGLSASDSNHTLISCDEEGYYAATNANEIRFSRAAFDILLSNSGRIKEISMNSRRKPASNSDEVNTPAAEATWTWSSNREELLTREKLRTKKHLDHAEKGTIPVYTINDVVSILIPLSLCEGYASLQVLRTSLMMKKALNLVHNEVIREYIHENFEVNFSFQTTKPPQDKQLKGPTSFCQSLKDANILSGGLLPGVSMTEPRSRHKQSDSLFQYLSKPRMNAELFSEQVEKMQNWEIDETCITVPFRGFVAVVLTISALAVITGTIIPFLDVIHIDGVDPSNMSTYIWVTVVFFMLLAQSWYVPNWAWHDFLHGRIVCRSVSELAAVTKINPQYILYKLLVSEKNLMLKTRGPYNSMFKQRSEDGFAIDVSCNTTTLFASGFVLFQGLGEYNWHIICLDARGGEELLTQQHDHWDQCHGVSLPADGSNLGKKAVLKLSETQFQGEKILGLFVADMKFG